ncbi:Hypothetical predicted protein [Pelobates cultripes]|uniref:Uncharacterized protein n=1 Tax=Pelobates cultripes TaxID=61616 RepID=A0AAD1VY00_PELCU|nr:Hypothetical predicted protein [Pelobates cultripes]
MTPFPTQHKIGRQRFLARRRRHATLQSTGVTLQSTDGTVVGHTTTPLVVAATKASTMPLRKQLGGNRILSQERSREANWTTVDRLFGLERPKSERAIAPYPAGLDWRIDPPQSLYQEQ